MAKKFRKKPVVIEALQFTGSHESVVAILEWVLSSRVRITHREHRDERRAPNGELSQMYDPEHLRINTLEGVMRADLGDWIIQGIQGEFYPCKPDIFEATYEEVLP